MLQVTEYWNKIVDDDSAIFKRKVLKGEYEIKSTFKIDNTLQDLKERWKNHPRMTIYKDKIVEDCGGYYGVHSYKEIKEV